MSLKEIGSAMNEDFIFPATQFTFIARSMGMSPFEDIHSQKPKKSLDLLPVSLHVRKFKSIGAFAFMVMHYILLSGKKNQASDDQYKF